MKVGILLSLLQISVLIPSITSVKNLTEIHFYFTTCGSTGSDGPSVGSNCLTTYQRNNSPIVSPPSLLFDFGDNHYEGAQGFRVPKSGLYNITVAGAAGGRGICSIDSGKGLVWRGQVYLTYKEELLIMVGQKGVGPCDIVSEDELPLCGHPPSSLSDSAQCQLDWKRWIQNHPDLVGLPSFVRDLNEAHIGGGGGGGASMLRKRNRPEAFDSDDLPLVIAGGGGGSGSNVSFDIIRDLTFRPAPGMSINDVDSEMLYYAFINAKATTHDPTGKYSPVEGGRGPVLDKDAENTPLRPGVGAGWSGRPLSQTEADTDSEPLVLERDFAQGGFDCARNIDSQPNQSAVIKTVQGGFGGGGGQCGGGGAGGGYTGGAILGLLLTVPGGGGYSYFDTDSISNDMGTNITSDGNGYVDLVLSDCGCTGSCEILDDMFECLCLNDTHLAPDELDCYQTQDLEFWEGPSVTVPTGDEVLPELNFQLLSFNTSVNIYSIDIELSVRGEDDVCLFLFVRNDSDVDVIVTSNVVRDSERAFTLSEINLQRLSPDGNLMLDFDTILYTPIHVSEVLLVSTGNCSIVGTTFRTNISIQDIDTELIGTPLNDLLFQNRTDIVTLAEMVIASERSTTPMAPLSDGHIAGIVIASSVTFVGVLLFILLMIVFTFKSFRRKVKDERLDEISLQGSGTYMPYHNGIMSNTSQKLPGFPDKLFIKSDQLKLGKIIGEGEFGSVYKAKMYQHPQDPPQIVAVKTLKGFFNQQHIDDLLRESKRMFQLDHPNVQAMIGICVDGGPIPFVVMPYMKHGCLLTFLRKNKDSLLLMQGEEDEVKAVTQTLTEMCLQIAKGMEYLANQNIIHRDLAARNCMIDDQQCICVADFGLSESMYSKTYFRQENFKSIPLPLKWLAPESFNTGVFSEKTDVWSFGVTCWEIFNGGRIPYPGVHAHSLPKLINRGHRMDKPDNLACIDSMYDVMKSCWLPQPEDRPTFASLVRTIEAELESMSEYLPLLVSTNLGRNIIQVVEVDPEQDVPANHRVQNLYFEG